MRLLAASSTVVPDPTPSVQVRNSLTPTLIAVFRRRGFAIAEDGQAVPAGVHHLHCLISRLDNGDLVRLMLDDATEGSATRSAFR